MISAKAEEILEEFSKSGSAESFGVAEILQGISMSISPDGHTEQEADEFLCVCAGEIRDAAQAFISRMQDPTGEDLWADDTTYPRSDWEHEVCNGNTQLGYHAWKEHRKEQS